jgi:CRISPR-associated protein Cmr2
MRSWALVITLGPVGGFIASGRRSRDLWWGSTWLSECACAVARLVIDPPPALGVKARLLVPSARRVREIGGLGERQRAYGGRVTNHLELELEAPSTVEVRALATQCEEAARSYLAEQLRRTLRRLGGEKTRKRVREAVEDVVEPHLYEAQVQAIEAGDFIETFSAWAPVEADLHRALERAWRLLDGRKAARVFDSPSWTREGRAKCDLDPGRDTVLKTANTRDRRVRGPEAARRHVSRRLLGIGPEEELDTLSLARRLAIFDPGPDLKRLPFPPISRVAADPWLHEVGADPATAAHLQRMRWYLETDAVQDNPFFFTWCSPARDPERPWDPAARRRGEGFFPFDASFLFEGGLAALVEEMRRLEERVARVPEDLRAACRHLETLRPWVEALHRAHGVPLPYYALLMMDGDGVGHALLAERDLERKAALVAALDRFADRAEEIVREHHGCAFYIGGDDLAAYLPLDRVMEAVLALEREFAGVQAAFPPDPGVSISAGIALAHVKADLRAVRRRAQRALAATKAERRRRLAESRGPARGWATVVDLPRSGGERTASGPLTELLTDLRSWSGLLQREELSLRSAAFLEELAERFADPTKNGQRGIELAPYRILAQSRRSEKKASRRLVERLQTVREGGWRPALRLAAELAIARRLCKAGCGEEKAAEEGAA